VKLNGNELIPAFLLFCRNVPSSTAAITASTASTRSSLCRMSEEDTSPPLSSSASSSIQNNNNLLVASGHNSHHPERPLHGSDSSDSGCALEEYTWVPHGLRPQQVSHHSYSFAYWPRGWKDHFYLDSRSYHRSRPKKKF
jgi:hypothetical protein